MSIALGWVLGCARPAPPATMSPPSVLDIPQTRPSAQAKATREAPPPTLVPDDGNRLVDATGLGAEVTAHLAWSKVDGCITKNEHSPCGRLVLTLLGERAQTTREVVLIARSEHPVDVGELPTLGALPMLYDASWFWAGESHDVRVVRSGDDLVVKHRVTSESPKADDGKWMDVRSVTLASGTNVRLPDVTASLKERIPVGLAAEDHKPLWYGPSATTDDAPCPDGYEHRGWGKGCYRVCAAPGAAGASTCPSATICQDPMGIGLYRCVPR